MVVTLEIGISVIVMYVSCCDEGNSGCDARNSGCDAGNSGCDV